MAKGTAVLDFGATPTDEATVTVGSQVGLVVGAHIEAFFMRDSTADNSVDEHEEAAALCPLSCGDVVADSGAGNGSFKINADPIAMLGSGTFQVRWVWDN